MRSSWLWIALIAAAGIALAVIFVVLPSRHVLVDDEAAKTAERAARSGRVQERLRELAESRALTPGRSGSDKLAAHSQLPVVPERGMIGARPDVQPAPKRGRSEETAGAAGNVAVAPEPLPNPELDMDPDDIPALSRLAVQDPDPDRREAAITFLGASDDPQVIPVLAQALSDQDEDVRMAAVQSLSDFTGEAPFEAVESALNDPSADIRYEALEVLADLDEQRAQPYLKRALTDPDEEVQSLAESLLDNEANAGATPAATAAPQVPQKAAR